MSERFPWSMFSWTQEQIEAYRLAMDQFTTPPTHPIPFERCIDWFLATNVTQTQTKSGKYTTKVESDTDKTTITISPTSPSHPAADAELTRTRSDDGSVTIVVTPKG